MNSFNIQDLKPNTFFTEEVFLDNRFLLLTSITPVTKELLNALTEWEFETVYSNGNIKNNLVASYSPSEPVIETVKSEQNDTQTKTAVLNSTIDEETKKDEIKRLMEINRIYSEYLDYIEKLFTKFATTRQLDINEISETVKTLITFIKENRRQVLRIQPQRNEANRNFLINHTMRCTVLSIAIGMQMKLDEDKLVELGITSILHEIGMIRLPPQLYMTNRKLNPAEKNEISTHPILSYNILKKAEFPVNICRGVLEHHEKFNGKGYPRHVNGENISSYARIISVACTYEAITAPRQYKDEKSTFAAMVEILKNEGMQYDPTVIKALLLTVSFYPIGSYVYLSNNKVAQVIDVNPENLKCPIVQFLTEKDEKGNLKTLKTSEDGIKIARILSKKEVNDVLSVLQSQMKK